MILQQNPDHQTWILMSKFIDVQIYILAQERLMRDDYSETISIYSTVTYRYRYVIYNI